jgi:exopolysaccharide biosynthesis polyprenyl glycosylphosphotransferase
MTQADEFFMSGATATHRAEDLVLPEGSRESRHHSIERPRPNPWRIKVATVAADGVALAAAMLVAFWLRTGLPGGDPGAWQEHLLVGATSLPVWLCVFANQRLYSARFITARLEELGRVGSAIAVSMLLTAGAAFSVQIYVARGWLGLTFMFSLLFVGVEREITRGVFASMRRRGALLRRVLIVGRNAEGLALAEMFATDPGLGYEVVGFVDDSVSEERASLFDRPVLGGVSGTLDAVHSHAASGVVIATTALDLPTINSLCRKLTEAGIHVELSSSLRDIAYQRLSIRQLGRFPVVYIEPVRLEGWRALAKRSYDVVAATLGLVVLAPFLILIGAAIKATSPGPVLFRQERVGQHGRKFFVFKFRTMLADAERLLPERVPLHKDPTDARVTRLGSFLRRFSLDELPQLVNVLRGDMSLVGPRPALENEMRIWTPELHNRLRVRPGITGMWQVGRNPDWSFDDYVRLDLYYVDNWSLLTDLAISLKTIPMMILGRGNR